MYLGAVTRIWICKNSLQHFYFQILYLYGQYKNLLLILMIYVSTPCSESRWSPAYQSSIGPVLFLNPEYIRWNQSTTAWSQKSFRSLILCASDCMNAFLCHSLSVIGLQFEYKHLLTKSRFQNLALPDKNITISNIIVPWHRKSSAKLSLLGKTW